MGNTVIDRLLDNYTIGLDGWIYTEDTLIDILQRSVLNDRLLRTLYYYIITIIKPSRHTAQ